MAGLTGLVLATTAVAQGPMPMPGSGAGLTAALSKLFGPAKAFSAQAEMNLQAKGSKEPVTFSTPFEMLDGQIRTEMDLAKMKNAQMSAEARQSMKQMGMDQAVIIVTPATKTMFMIYPNLKACVEMPLPERDANAYEKTPQIETVEVGKETLDGHPCVKNKVTLTEAGGNKYEGFTWTATDLNRFPIQMQFQDDSGLQTIRFRNVQLKAPEASRFVPPAAYAQYKSMQELMMNSMQKFMGGLPRK